MQPVSTEEIVGSTLQVTELQNNSNLTYSLTNIYIIYIYILYIYYIYIIYIYIYTYILSESTY